MTLMGHGHAVRRGQHALAYVRIIDVQRFQRQLKQRTRIHTSKGVESLGSEISQRSYGGGQNPHDPPGPECFSGASCCRALPSLAKVAKVSGDMVCGPANPLAPPRVAIANGHRSQDPVEELCI